MVLDAGSLIGYFSPMLPWEEIMCWDSQCSHFIFHLVKGRLFWLEGRFQDSQATQGKPCLKKLKKYIIILYTVHLKPKFFSEWIFSILCLGLRWVYIFY